MRLFLSILTFLLLSSLATTYSFMMDSENNMGGDNRGSQVLAVADK